MSLAGYVVRRLGLAVFVVWAAFTTTFVILYLLPSDPVLTMLNKGGEGANVDPAAAAALRAEYGFDKPVPVQYVTRLLAAVRGDLGRSMQSGQPVVTTIVDALPQTALLAAVALSIALVVSSLLASAAVLTSSRALRHALLSLPPLGAAIPTFWLGLVLLQVFSFRFGWFPATGNDGWQSLVLPAVTLAVPTAAVLTQVLAKSLGSTWEQPFVETARAKGLPRSTVHLRHVIRNGSIPTLTMVAIIIGNTLAGAVVTETVFSRIGVGRLTQSAVMSQDIPLVQGVVVLSAVVFVVVNLAADLVYPVVDPRIARVSVAA